MSNYRANPEDKKEAPKSNYRANSEAKTEASKSNYTANPEAKKQASMSKYRANHEAKQVAAKHKYEENHLPKKIISRRSSKLMYAVRPDLKKSMAIAWYFKRRIQMLARSRAYYSANKNLVCINRKARYALQAPRIL